MHSNFYNTGSGKDFVDSSKGIDLLSPRAEEICISRGDRVVFAYENFKEYGWVRWIGRQNSGDLGSELMAGVEFDNPVGHDNHKINGHALFEAATRHASILPASSLIVVEDLLSQESTAKGPKKHFKTEIPLGRDRPMSNLSTFHKMAFERLSNSSKPIAKSFFTKSTDQSSTSFGENENWDILPHMAYSSHKNMLESSKETLNDIRNKPMKSKSRSNTKGPSVTSLLDDKKLHTSYPHVLKSPSRPTSLSTRDTSTSIGICGGGIISGEDKDSEYIDSPTDISPFYRLSHHGIDQLEVVSDGESNSEDEDLTIGSLVEIVFKDSSKWKNKKLLFGVIRWIGIVPGDQKEDRKVAGIEMEDPEDGLSDGTLKGKHYFTCPIGKAMFVPVSMCVKDSRFLESVSSNQRASLAFGSMDCQPVIGSIAPLITLEEVRAMFGRNKGIQGHQNSCYLDATLFSMFAFTSVFDTLLFRPPISTDIKEYLDVQSVLREEIVNPLRKNMFVRADRIMKLRTMLDHLSSVRGLTTEEKDPEEFLQSLLAQILQAEPFLQLSSGQEAYHYQLFVEKDDKLSLPSVQTLFDQSFLTSDIKLKEIPSCLIIQMPRFGKDYKMYPRILPSMILDVTDVIEDSPRQCIICGKLAEYECRECFGHCGSGLESISFCAKCMDKVHSHKKRGSHSSMRKLKIPPEFQMLADHYGTIPRVYMELFAVVCIETSHYVTFTRCGSGDDATWCFFDSMADRKGEQHGYNIPTVVECGDLMQWVGEESSQMLHTVTDNKALPDLPRRLLCDAYMCFYQSPKVMMYR